MIAKTHSKLSLLKTRRPKPARFSSTSSVKICPLAVDQPIPHLVEPAGEPIDLLAWAQNSRSLVDTWLREHGALLFRGFQAPTIDRFQAFAEVCSSDLLYYTERSTPRSEVSGKVYTSTEYPPELSIPMHNELSYARSWPTQIFFFCKQPAEQGGETPIADSRSVYREIPSAVREEFARRRVLYVRHYGPHLGLTWQEAFQTGEPGAVECFCLDAEIEWQWLDEDRLVTRAVRPAVIDHRRTGEPLWFNQAHLHHLSALAPAAREALASVVGEDEMPFNTYYGDGAPIDEEALAAVRQAYDRTSVFYPWQRGDVLMLDNELMAHGRAPFSGGQRQVVVAMA